VRVRLIFALVFTSTLLATLGGAASSQAAPGALRILVDENLPEPALGLEIEASRG
jgi:hypothetical protein